MLNKKSNVERMDTYNTTVENILSETKNFRHFYINQCKRNQIGQSPEINRSLKQCMSNNKRFQRLSLCHQKSFKLSQMKMVISCVQNQPQLLEVLLNHNRITEKLVCTFIESMHSNKNITSLEFFGNKLTDKSCSHFAVLLQKNTFLKRLKLGDNKITEKGAKLLANGLKVNNCLIQLHLGGNLIGNEGLKHISEALKSNKSLTSLGLRNNKIGQKGIRYLSTALESDEIVLSDIQLKGNRVGPDGARHLANSLKKNKSLKVLELQSNDIGSKGIKFILDALKGNNEISSLNFNNNNVTDDACSHISEFLKTAACFSTLGLANNSIGRGVGIFAKALSTSSLTGLDLGNNKIGDGGAISLGKCLENNKCMSSLDLRCCGINSIGFVALAKALEKNNSLFHLDLGSNFARNKGAIALSKSLAVNSTLSRLCLTENQIYQEGGVAMAVGLQKNYALRNFSYGGQGTNANRIDSSVRRVIDEIVKENKRIYDRHLKEQSRLDKEGYGRKVDIKNFHNSKLKVRYMDIKSTMKKMNNRSGSGEGKRKWPSWLENPIQFIENPMPLKELDTRLEYIFRSNLLRAENSKFSGFFFIGNVLNTLHKVYPDTKDTVDEVMVVRLAYKHEKYYVHLSREMVKTQIKYVGYDSGMYSREKSTSCAPMVSSVYVKRTKSNFDSPNKEDLMINEKERVPQSVSFNRTRNIEDVSIPMRSSRMSGRGRGYSNVRSRLIGRGGFDQFKTPRMKKKLKPLHTLKGFDDTPFRSKRISYSPGLFGMMNNNNPYQSPVQLGVPLNNNSPITPFNTPLTPNDERDLTKKFTIPNMKFGNNFVNQNVNVGRKLNFSLNRRMSSNPNLTTRSFQNIDHKNNPYFTNINGGDDQKKQEKMEESNEKKPFLSDEMVVYDGDGKNIGQRRFFDFNSFSSSKQTQEGKEKDKKNEKYKKEQLEYLNELLRNNTSNVEFIDWSYSGEEDFNKGSSWDD